MHMSIHMSTHVCPYMSGQLHRPTTPAHTTNHIGQPHRSTTSGNHIGKPQRPTTSVNHIGQPQPHTGPCLPSAIAHCNGPSRPLANATPRPLLSNIHGHLSATAVDCLSATTIHRPLLPIGRSRPHSHPSDTAVYTAAHRPPSRIGHTCLSAPGRTMATTAHRPQPLTGHVYRPQSSLSYCRPSATVTYPHTRLTHSHTHAHKHVRT